MELAGSVVVEVQFKHFQESLGRDDLLNSFDFSYCYSVCGESVCVWFVLDSQETIHCAAVSESDSEWAITLTRHYFQRL